MFTVVGVGNHVRMPTSFRPLTVVAVAAILSLSGCGGSNDETEQPGEVEIDLQEETGAAGVRAVLSFVDKNHTKVTVDGLDAGEPSGGGKHPAAIRRGSCDDPGAMAARLQALKDGTSTSTVTHGLADLLAGDYSIAILVSASRPEVLACGDVPDA
jgi:hypothetical protein